MTSVSAEPTSVRSFMKRANGSMTNAPSKACPSTVAKSIHAPAATSRSTASQFTTL
jgi:hypothetical protein